MVKDIPDMCKPTSSFGMCLMQMPEIDPDAAAIWRSIMAGEIAENANCSEGSEFFAESAKKGNYILDSRNLLG